MIAEPVTYINDLDADVDVVDEYEDQTLAIPQYSITSYGIDYDVEGLVKRMNNDDILIPAFSANSSGVMRFRHVLLNRSCWVYPCPAYFSIAWKMTGTK